MYSVKEFTEDWTDICKLHTSLVYVQTFVILVFKRNICLIHPLAHSHQAKAKMKTKIFFNVCCSFFNLSGLFFDLFHLV